MGNEIQIYDTTLRDGMQGIEINYTLEDKVQIAHKLDDLGVDYIEGGFPLSNDKEAAFFERMRKEKLSHAKVASFGSTRKPGIRAGEDAHILALLDAETPVVTVVGKTSKLHVVQVLKTDENENLSMIFDSIDFLKREGKEVIFDLEHFFDGYKADPDYALKVLRTVAEAKADCLVLCDTNGGTLPHEIISILDDLSEEKIGPLGVHYHNDCGTADANALLSLDHGAVHVQGTINGWGERCGNANLCTLIPNIGLKMDLDISPNKHMKKLTALARFVAEKANIIPEKRLPYVGTAAFSHKAGQHADVVSKADYLMEHIDSSLVGNERKVLLSELAGKSTIVDKISKYGNYSKTSPIVNKLVNILKEKESEGYEYEAAEASFDLIIRKALGKYTSLLELNNYHLESYKTGDTPSKTVGRIFLRSQSNDIMGAAVGIGPVETLDMALRDALVPVHGYINSITLTDYRVRVLNPEEASAAKVRVFISSTDKKRSWDTVGVSENIVEASWEALVDAMEYYYNNYILT